MKFAALIAVLLLSSDVAFGINATHWENGYEKKATDEVEMVWLGNTNWIVKFTNPAGERRNILLDCALGDQLDRVMQTVGAITIDYIFIGHTHGDHAQGAAEFANRFGATMYTGYPICNDVDPSTGARCITTTPGQVVVTPDGLVIEITATPHSNTGVGRDPDPYSYRLTFPGPGQSSIFYSDTFRPYYEDDESIYSGRYVDMLHENINPAGVSVFFLLATPMIDVQYFDEVADAINPRYILPQHLCGLFPIVGDECEGYVDPHPWMLTDLGTPERPTQLLYLGNFFTTLILFGDDAAFVPRDYHERYKENLELDGYVPSGKKTPGMSP